MMAEFLTEAAVLAAEKLDARLAPSRSIIRSIAEIVRRCLAHAGELEHQTAANVHILLARLAEDIAATCTLASLAYEMQAPGSSGIDLRGWPCSRLHRP